MQKNNQYISKSSNSEPVKLKFGIDQLLAEDFKPLVTTSAPIDRSVGKSENGASVPCSDCVTSLFRCCRLDQSESCGQGNVSNFLGHHFGYGATMGSYTVQPIRPFATRPSK